MEKEAHEEEARRGFPQEEGPLVQSLDLALQPFKGAIARVVRVCTENGPMALGNSMFPLWSCSLSLTTAMLHKED